MITVTVNPGICGLSTVITAESEDQMTATIKVESQCQNIREMGEIIKEVNAFSECFAKICETQIYAAANRHCRHPVCPVPCAVIKAVEAACGLALPQDVTIEIRKTP